MDYATRILTESFYQRDTSAVAQDLLGCRLISRIGRRLSSGIIVETEAYLPAGDSACHCSRGRTPSNKSMFGRPGRAYVYPIHAGFCFNVVTGNPDQGCAVLIRALHPTVGIKAMRSRRGTDDPRRLTTGPSRLCQALAVNRNVDGWNLTLGKRVWIESGQRNFECDKAKSMMTTTRIGVTSAEALQLRFLIANDPFVSGPKRLRCC